MGVMTATDCLGSLLSLTADLLASTTKTAMFRILTIRTSLRTLEPNHLAEKRQRFVTLPISAN